MIHLLGLSARCIILIKKINKAKTKDFFEHQQKKLLYNIWVKTIKYMINTVNGLNPEGCKFMVAFV